MYALDRVPAFTRNYQRAGGARTLADYYTAAYGGSSFDRRLRSRITFSDHCLATDPVFAEVHLVSCRNVLIYFDETLQDRAIGLFTRGAGAARLPRPRIARDAAHLARTRRPFEECRPRRADLSAERVMADRARRAAGPRTRR